MLGVIALGRGFSLFPHRLLVPGMDKRDAASFTIGHLKKKTITFLLLQSFSQLQVLVAIHFQLKPENFYLSLLPDTIFSASPEGPASFVCHFPVCDKFCELPSSLGRGDWLGSTIHLQLPMILRDIFAADTWSPGLSSSSSRLMLASFE